MLLFLLNSQQFCMQSLVLTLPPHNLQMWFVSEQRFNETSFAHYIKDLTTVKSSVWQNVARVLSLETLIILEPQVLQMSHASIKDHKSKPFYLWKVGYIRLFIRLSKLRLPALMTTRKGGGGGVKDWWQNTLLLLKFLGKPLISLETF